MSFLAPFFLLGALAIAAPVIFHLIRRTTRDRTVFSSLMFLLPTPPRLTRRSRLEHWLLLLLRCLALALLAFGFSRPFLKESALNDAPGGSTKRVVVLVDVSASMRRSGLWVEAQSKVESTLRSLSAADQAAVFIFSRDAQPLVNFGEWNAAAPDARVALATARLAAVSPGWSGTNSGAALITAAEALVDTEGSQNIGTRQIVLVSDLQLGSRLEAIQAYEWPKGVELVVEPLKPRNPTNAGIQLLAEAADTDRQSATSVRVRVSNAGNSTREQFKVGWVKTPAGEFSGAPVETYVPPGQSRVVSLPVASAGGAESITLLGDDEDFDNTVYVIPPAQQKINLVYLGAEKADDTRQPLFFLKRALPETPRLSVRVTAIPATQPLAGELLAAPLYVVTDALPKAQGVVLREQALAGKTVLFSPKSAAAGATLGFLLGMDALAAEEGRPASYAMLAEIDFQHPLFAAFADPRYSDFTKIHFWKYRKLDASALPGARVLAKFDNGDPALLEIPAGKGRVLVLSAGWNPEDSQLAVSSKFVPLIYSVLEFSGALTTQPGQYFIGDSVPLPTEFRETAATVRMPDGSSLPLTAGAAVFTLAAQPGIYRFTAGQRAQAFSVNLDAAESRTAPIAVDELERLGAPLAKKSQALKPAAAAREVALQGSAAESRQKLWRWFIIATLVVLLGESLLAGWTARKPSLVEQPTSS
ncbi:MAG TPA: BatA domain-containing protein [Opitutaceae bacterium]|nr:BatA domain-containing protein [Opitutaceae bacterium]